MTGCDESETKAPPPPKPVIQPPFNVFDIRGEFGELDTGKFNCEKTPKASKDLFFESVYDEESENSSVVDPEAQKTYKERTKEIRIMESGLAKTANRYVLSKPPRGEIAACVLEWLDTWAQDDALLGKSNHMGDFIRKWVLASIALSYIQIKDETTLDPKKRKRVEAWIQSLMNRVMADFSTRTDKKSRNNNHMYWAAWSVVAASSAINDDIGFNWGLDQARQGIVDIQPDGTLPLEMARGQKAYMYHHYAAIPLFMMADAAEKNGVDIYKENNEGLKRFAQRILNSMEDQSYFERQSGEKQNLERVITSSNLSWLEPYYEHYRDPVALKWLTAYRPVRHSRVGGDATLLYGAESED